MVLNLINQNEHDDYMDLNALFETLLAKTVHTLAEDKTKDYEVNLVLSNDKQVRSYNHNFRGLDKTTDVLSFEGDLTLDDTVQLGDIIISTDAVKRQAAEYGHSEKREVCFLFVHGLLHLFGYDHQNETEEKAMFSLQREILDDVVGRDD
ncbi:MAG TPA: rRNA maturation RNase YbeY [Erysipelothrix sp.]